MYKEASFSAPSIRKKRFAGKNDSSAPSGRALSCAANRQKQPVLHREANHHRTVRGVPYPSRPPLRREATLSGAKESWGVARGDRKPWCPIPFCPSPREGRVLHAAACKSPLPPGGGNPLAPGGARPRTPQRAKLLAAEGGNYNPSEGRVSPPAAHRRIGGGLSSADGKNAACACFCPCPGGHIPVGDYSHFSQTSGQYPTVA